MKEAIDEDELRTLAARASTLDERLSGPYVPIAEPGSREVANARYNAWVVSATDGQSALLQRLCAYRGLDLTAIKPLFGPVALPPGEPMPGWIETFVWLFSALQTEPASDRVCPRSDHTPLPYEQLFYPLVAAARRKRDAAADARWLSVFSDQALADLNRALLKPVCDICTRALNDRFSLERYVAGGRTGLFAGGRNLDDQVADFLKGLRKAGLKAFFLDRPVLARLLSTVVAQWQAATLEFVERLYRDLPVGINSLAGGSLPGRVVQIGAGLSDLHRGGRSVYKVTFESGLSIGYKPKDLHIDLAWESLLNWLEAEGAPASAGTVATRACDTYGWVEWLSSRPCASLTEAREFFHRSGATLCLVRMLQGSDFHFENVLAHGSVPVLVDLETLMHARQKEEPPVVGPEKAMAEAARMLDDSVCSTAYLPGWLSVPGGTAVLVGGLDMHGRPDTRIEDGMDARAEKSAATDFEARGNLPRLDGRPLRVQDFEAELIAGYEAMFDFLRARGADMASDGGPLDSFTDLTIRPVLRATQLYGLLQIRALGRTSVVDGVAWSLHFDFLYRMSLTADDVLPIAAVCDYERASMAAFDAPFFEGRTTSRDVVCGDGTVVPEFFRGSCLDEVRTRLRSLGDHLLNRDRTMIRLALRATATHQAAETTSVDENTTADLPPLPASRRRLVDAAVRLADAIDQTSVKAGGGATWVAVSPVTSDERAVQIQPQAPAFLTGTLGIATFLAALHRVSGDPVHRARIEPLIAILVDQAADPAKMRSISRLNTLGLGSGVGGLVYGLAVLAGFLDESRLLDLARSYARLITDARIADDKDFDLFSGAAGAIVGLLALYRHDSSPAIGDRIRACSAHLLQNRTSTRFGGMAWRGRRWKVPQAGLMHGASGVALALARAGHALDAPEPREAAEQGLAYERALFELCGGWPDLRDTADREGIAEAPHRSDYANGAAGIGMARLELVRNAGPTAELTTDIERTVRAVRANPGAMTDELFSGNAGRIVFLARAGYFLNDDTLRSDANIQIARLLAIADDHGRFRWRAGKDGDNPGLFNGAAGVGLALLQSACPEDIPDLLALADVGGPVS